MTRFTRYTLYQIEAALGYVGRAVYTSVAPLVIKAWRTPEPVPFEARFSGEELSLKVGDSWGRLFDCAWFQFTGQVPEAAAGKAVVLLLDVNGEMLVVDAQGEPARGLTNVASEFDKSLGLPGKRVLPLFDRAAGGEPVEVWADAGMNDLFGFVQENGQIKEASVAVCDDETRRLYYDLEVLLDSLKALPEQSPRFQQILEALNDAVHALWSGIRPETVALARQALAPELAKQGGDPSLVISAVGHAHIDLAWLWPLRETYRKGARTFATALANMERYPNYVFAASQAQLFQWMKDLYPGLYARIKQKVAEGRIEPQGALWVECDANLTGGESLVRQVLYGSRFFQEEFGIRPDYIWLPDTFGYSAAMPQIFIKAGMRCFSTQKLSWSLINKFPHHSFHWQGIDGTAVLVHMLAEETYNSPALPRSIGKIETNYAEKGVSGAALMAFGIGDGGGGPGEEHLERLERLRSFAGLSPVRQESTKNFIDRWAQDSGRFPTWAGELYLERHQGTLTSNARSKWYNRRLELALRDLEWLASAAEALGLSPYPAEAVERIWKETLLYQFHDILPGSSIKRVYDESLAAYARLLEQTEAMTSTALDALAARVSTAGMRSPVILFNTLSWDRAEWLKLGGGWQRVEVPAMGCAAVDAGAAGGEAFTVSATPDRLENDRLVVTFGVDGAITSIWDKSAAREVLRHGESANRLLVYADHGDAWDFAMDYAASRPAALELVSSEAEVDGPLAAVRQLYRLGHSELRLAVRLTQGSALLEFSARLRWREPRTMLRAVFPVNVFAETASFEIQYGHVRRATHTNTTWDLAKDEVPAQKWADLSQRDCGVALINDSKYGHRVKGHTLELNLLRSVPYTGPRLVADESVQPGEPHHAYSDQADHAFRYALLPHAGDAVAGNVIQSAYEFNFPMRQVPLPRVDAPAGGAGDPARKSFIQLSSPQVIVEAVKRAEDGSGWVIRLYESTGASARVSLRVSLPCQGAVECDLLERSLPGALAEEDGALRLEFHPFEIKTLRLRGTYGQ